MAVQRFRVWFRKGERVRYISHLDVLRYWERCLRRAGLPLSYSQGFTPHPKLAFAGPLPLGFLAEAEVVDVTLDERIPALDFESRLAAETSPDLSVVRVAEISLATPPPQKALVWADYRVELPAVDPGVACDAVAAFVGQREFSWTEERREKERTYNLRATVAELSVQPSDGGVQLTMRLQSTPEMMARPEQLVAALFPGVEPAVVTRTALLFDEPSPAHDAWRRRGRFEG
jgi:radical SAM-linked protein